MLSLVKQYHILKLKHKVKKLSKPRKRMAALGIANKIGKYYIPFLDYDVKDRNLVYRDVCRLVLKYHLFGFAMRETKNGFHVIFPFNLCSKRLCERIVLESKCDDEFKLFTLVNGFSVLRVAGKSKLGTFEIYKNKKFNINSFNSIIGKSILEVFEMLEDIGNKVLKSGGTDGGIQNYQN